MYPELAEATHTYRALLDEVVRRQAALIARWLGVGFVHGVMNTDNTSIAGETIDYGPCAFVDTYDPGTVFSSIDRFGRYAYDQQPKIGAWNLARLAETLLPLLGDEPDAQLASAQEALDAYPALFEDAWDAELRRKLGLVDAREDDRALAQDLLDTMAEQKADFTLTFRGLVAALDEMDEMEGSVAHEASARAQFDEPTAFDAWAARWRARLASEGRPNDVVRAALRAANPVFIPRNHRVEEVIAAAADGDLRPFEALLGAVTRPYLDDPRHAHLAAAPKPHEVVQETFCGT